MYALDRYVLHSLRTLVSVFGYVLRCIFTAKCGRAGTRIYGRWIIGECNSSTRNNSGKRHWKHCVPDSIRAFIPQNAQTSPSRYQTAQYFDQ